MAVKIKLKRLGMIRNPQYRIVIADARSKRDGRAIEEIGLYHPKENPSRIEVNSERAQYWLSVGAQPTDPVLKIFKLTGDWQKFKGEPAPATPLLVAEPKPDRHAAYEAAARESLSSDTGAAATTPKKARKPAKAEETAEVPAAEEKPEGEA
ncbi:30S ribosomal protein S16 [Microbispora amethystogenes]|uniref:Small ribosomal subunit protein bS16 n=1 Tax=Microbispora cellulosiformans TaxID=2614688 RepID=A0A5J5JTG1_9ACTN|nr:30S ribosomal protein S16 [Microbispora cellulosiformans]KAA9373422.1 30S ribosomal protein S16 [Microbispora cellulosiformans]